MRNGCVFAPHVVRLSLFDRKGYRSEHSVPDLIAVCAGERGEVMKWQL